MHSINSFLETTVHALNQGRRNAKMAMEFLTHLLNQQSCNEDFYTFVNPVSHYPAPKSRVAKIYEDCYQVFRVGRQGFPRLIRIVIFFEGAMYDNFLIRLDEERGLCELEDIDLGDIANRGIASICLQNLETVLTKTGGVQKIIAGLAPRDYVDREHLYHFYINKNGFVQKRPVTKYAWGLVEKTLANN